MAVDITDVKRLKDLTGVFALAGGVPKPTLLGSAQAAETGSSFRQISDSHAGFDKPANPDVRATCLASVARIKTASFIASIWPMQTRGPPPNGR